MKPSFPIYVISKGRHDHCLTANFLARDGVDFRIVVEPQERDAYANKYGSDRILVLPFSNLGLGSIPARNWVWEHSKIGGHERHWILDDNMRDVYRRHHGKRVYCHSGYAFKVLEEFVSRYENVAIAGFNYHMFVPDHRKKAPFVLNVYVYSNFLIMNSIPQRWRGRYNEDTDLCLQVLSAGLCTVQFNAFCVAKMQTMKMKGGNTDLLYAGDGRLTMSRSLERMWPGIVSTTRKFRRPQHAVAYNWGRFDNKLIRKPGFDSIPNEANEFGMEFKRVGGRAKNPKTYSMLSGKSASK